MQMIKLNLLKPKWSGTMAHLSFFLSFYGWYNSQRVKQYIHRLLNNIPEPEPMIKVTCSKYTVEDLNATE
jgi:hypothetical protein